MQNVTSFLHKPSRNIITSLRNVCFRRRHPQQQFLRNITFTKQVAPDRFSPAVKTGPSFQKLHIEDIVTSSQSSIPSQDAWPNLPTTTLEHLLQTVASEHKHEVTTDLARYLCSERGVKPSRSIFQALLTANISPAGSIGEVIHLLAQMQELDIPLREEEHQTLLRILAVHPDYVLGMEVLTRLEKDWHGFGETGRQYVVAGYVRDLQLEQAVEEIRAMRKEDIPVATWVYDLVVSVLCGVWEFEEAIKVMRMRVEEVGPEQASAVWLYMLEQAVYVSNVSLRSQINID
jgi:hypothetical protein